MWNQIISELFVNIASVWFGVVFVEFQISSLESREKILVLIFRFLVGILSLVTAKYFREKAQRRK